MAEPAFDVARFELVRDEANQLAFVFESYTEERVYLKPGRKWHMLQHESGHLYVTCEDAAEDEDAEFVVDLFEHTVTQGEDGEVMITDPDDREYDLDSFQRRFAPIALPLHIVGKEESELDGFLLKQSVAGAFVLWSLPRVYHLAVGSAALTASQWYHSWWPWWQKSLQDLGLDVHAHLRRAAPTAQASKLSRDEGRFRFLPTPTMSTYALLHVLVRLGSASKGSHQKSRNHREKFFHLLKLFVGRFLKDADLHFSVCLDPGVQVLPGFVCDGRDRVSILVKHGILDMSAVALSANEEITPTVERLRKCANVENIPVVDALTMIYEHGRQSTWLYKQLLLSVGLLIEGGVIEMDCSSQSEGEKEDDNMVVDGAANDNMEILGDSAAVQRRSRRLTKEKIRMALRSRISSDTKMLVLQAFLSLRQHFHDAQNISVAFDGSRLGNLPRLLGFICRPDGHGQWLPPQDMAPLSRIQNPQTDVLCICVAQIFTCA